MVNNVTDSDETLGTLRELLRWTRIQAIVLIGERISNALHDDKDKLLYHYSDGNNSAREIGLKIGLHHSNVARRWKDWAKTGILEPSPRFEGRWQKVIPLEELGIEIPKPSPVIPKKDEKLPESTESVIEPGTRPTANSSH